MDIVHDGKLFWAKKRGKKKCEISSQWHFKVKSHFAIFQVFLFLRSTFCFQFLCSEYKRLWGITQRCFICIFFSSSQRSKIWVISNVNVICLPTQHQGVHKNSFQKCPCIPESNWNLKMLVFKERGKPEYLKKNLSEQSREPTTNSTYIRWRRVRESNPGHIGDRRALSTLHNPCSLPTLLHYWMKPGAPDETK